MKTGPKCTICTHADKNLINERIMSGLSARGIAREFPELNYAAVNRHKTNHLPKELLKAKKMQEIDYADKLLDRVEDLYSRAHDIIDKAEDKGSFREAVSAIKEARSNLELTAKLVGQIKTGTHINLTYSPQYVELRQVLVNTLQPYPEVREKVVEALERAEATEIIDV